MPDKLNSPSSASRTKDPDGYYSIARFFDEESGIPVVRKFGILNAQNILYMQAELVQLEAELACIVHEDAESGDAERENYRYSARALQKSMEGIESFQWEKILEIRQKLKEYNKAVLRYQKLRTMPKPASWTLRSIRHILNIVKHKVYYLMDIDANSWDANQEYDLVAIQSRNEESDKFTKWMTGSCLPWAHKWFCWRYKKSDPDKELVYYSDRKIHISVTIVRYFLAMMFPAATMIMLCIVRRMMLRLILVLIFSGLFTVVVAFCTKARPVETFMATAA
ncbi:hypothetical protein N0V90_003366 [Kalmusia sp. IMI 367209]|nr:hypothetical protein N0V90_003366 [Kalmusia sp. IMI 367209]